MEGDIIVTDNGSGLPRNNASLECMSLDRGGGDWFLSYSRSSDMLYYHSIWKLHARVSLSWETDKLLTLFRSTGEKP